MTARPTPPPRPPADLLEAGDDHRPRLGERWAALPRRIRIAAVAATTTAAALAAGALLTTGTPGTPDRPNSPMPPAPWPIHATDITYTGLTGRADPTTRTFAFTLRAEATSRTPVTVETVRQGYRGLRLDVTPGPPIALRAGRPQRITVTVTVRSCDGIPLDAALPFLDVTLRNARARQEISQILGTAYAQDLSRSLRHICRPTERHAVPELRVRTIR